jgi:ribonuclease HI
VCAGCRKRDFALNLFPMELQACIKSLQVASQLGMRHVILQTDTVMVKYANLSSDYDLSINGGLVVKLKDIFFREFASADVSHKSRDCNQEAGALAKLGVECQAEDNPILDNMPDCILVLVAADSALPTG